MRTVTVGGVEYALPFADLLRPLTADEYAALEESVRSHGIKSPATTYLSRAYGRAVIDGSNRADLAREYGLPLPTVDLGPLSDEAARDLAYSLNLDRRQTTPEEMRALAEARRGRVKAARGRGQSLRAIAEAEGVSLGQVQRDVAAADPPAPEPGDTPDDPVPDGKVRGRDGKTYPASAGDTPERLLERTRRNLDRAIEGCVELADGDLAARLLQLGRMHGVPLKIEDGACVWPALVGVRAVLADLAAAGFGGGD